MLITRNCSWARIQYFLSGPEAEVPGDVRTGVQRPGQSRPSFRASYGLQNRWLGRTANVGNSMTEPVAITSFRDKLLNRMLRDQIIAVTKQVHLLTLLLRSSKVPWPAKVVASCSIAYVFSPIQLIPSFIPVIGQLDDVAVLFVGTKLIRKLTPAAALRECEAQSDSTFAHCLAKWRYMAQRRERRLSPA
jgi:uncharacterized membrane protein YkvA (DUF1232 family)